MKRRGGCTRGPCRRGDAAVRQDARARRLSLDLHRGEIFGLLGPNGAGKTTLIRTILDLIRPDRGRVEVLMYGKRPTLPELWRWLRAA